MKNSQKSGPQEKSELQELLKNVNYNPQSYSGRGMYGKECLAIVTNDKEKEVLSEIFIYLVRNNYDSTEIVSLVNALKEYKSDSMGKKYVYYWPYEKFEDEGEDEDTI